MNVLPLIIIFVLMLLFKSSVLQPFAQPDQSTSIALGFILLFAFLFGKRINKLRLPHITGFIIAGIICGPFALKFLSTTEVEDLQLLDGLALSLIALTAGGEMHLEKLKGSFRLISSVVISQTATLLAGFMAVGALGFSLYPVFPGSTIYHALAVSILAGILATATSPSTTIAVITETGSRGKYSDFVLNTAVFKDFLVIAIFALALSLSKSLLNSEESFDLNFLFQVFKELGGSFLIGILVGAGIILYLKFIKAELTVFILGVAFFTFQTSHNYGYHPLLICLLAGFIVQNFSSQGENLISALEKISMPVYVVFFAISGASLDLGTLKGLWLLALTIVVLRAVLKFIGTYLGASLVKEEPGIQRHSWTGFISQAGVALGMAIVVAENFPEWGEQFKALALGVIAINQVVGPVLFHWLLLKKGEASIKPDYTPIDGSI